MKADFLKILKEEYEIYLRKGDPCRDFSKVARKQFIYSFD